jgi:hypothetical protein
MSGTREIVRPTGHWPASAADRLGWMRRGVGELDGAT